MKTSFTQLFTLAILAGLTCTFPLHAADLTWDVDPNTVNPQDGAGTWDTTTNNWWDGANSVVWDNSTPANAIFGTNSGTAGAVTVGAGLTINVGNLTFYPPSLGNYNLTPGDASSRLSFSPGSTISVASGLTITNTVVLTGSSSFTKTGPGSFSLRPATANLNSGLTVVNNGLLVMGSASGRVVIPGDLIVTNTGIARLGSSSTIANTATVSVATGATFDMNGGSQTVPVFILNGGTVIQTSTEALAVDNFDARSGMLTQTVGSGAKLDGNLTKTTSGSVSLTSKGSASASGLTNTTVNQGNLILDYGFQNSSKLADVGGVLNMNGGTLIFTNGTATETLGAVILAGGVITNASGTVKLSAANTYDMRAGECYTVLAGTGISLTKSTPGTVILGADNTYNGGTLISAGTLQIGNGGAGGLPGSISAAITNNGTLVYNRSVAPANISAVISGTGSLVNIGSANVPLTGANTYSGSTTISNGSISLTGSSTLGDGTGTLNLSGGTLTTTASRTASSAPVPNPINVTADSAITTASASSTVDLNLTNNSIGGSAGTLTFSNAAVSGTGIFQPRFSGSGFNFSRPMIIANGGSGTTRVDSFNTTGTTQTFSGAISGTGSYRRTASISGTGGTTVLSGINTYTGATDVNQGVLVVNGTLGASTVTVAANGTLGGNGTLNGPVTISGNLSPGSSIGTLTISNTLTFQSSGTHNAELNKTLGTNDLVRGITTVAYAGTLVVNNLSGTLAANDTFKLFDAANYTGSFTATNLPALDAGLAWDTTGLTANGTIKVVSVGGGQPTLNFTQTGNNLQFTWTGGFKLQSQTNSLATGLTGTWFDYPNGGTSPVNTTNNPANPSVFYRLISTP